MEDPRLAGPSSAPTAALEQPVPEVPVPVRLAARRFAEVICPPEIRAGQRADRVLREFGLMLGSLPPAARKALVAALLILDQGARLYPPSRGRRFARLDDQVAGAYIRALLARHGAAAEMLQRLKSVFTMCYYELPEVQREIGYDPGPYIAAVSRRRLESYGPQIRAGEAAVTAPAGSAQIRSDQTRAKSSQPGTSTGQPGTGTGQS